MARYITALLLLFGMLIGQSQINVQHVTDDLNVNDKQGFFYALPRTVFQVDVMILKTEHFAGPYAEYAARYLDLNDVISKDYNSYSIENIELSTIAEPDPGHFYFVEISEKTTKEQDKTILSMSDAGLIVGLQPASINQSKGNVEVKGENIYDGLFKYFAETNLFESFDTIIKKVVVDTVSVEKVYYDRKWVEKSDEQKAVEAANMISKIRESRYNLLTGYHEIAYDAGSIAYMDKELQTLEKEYLSLFTGISVTKKLRFTYSVYPVAGEENMQLPVFNFSERTGIRDINSAGGEKFYLNIEELNISQEMLAIQKAREQSGKERGFYYRIPATAKITLEINNDLIVQGIYKIAQLGTVNYLPSSTPGVEFHEKTGSIQRVVVD